jgi:DNA polymerase-3 subunit beta
MSKRPAAFTLTDPVTLDVTFAAAAIAKDLALLARIAERKKVIDVTRYALLEADGAHARLVVTDLDVRLVARVSAETATAGRALVPCATLRDLVQLAAPSAKVRVVATAKAVHLSVDGYESKLGLPNLNDFPAELPQATGSTVSIGADAFARMASHVQKVLLPAGGPCAAARVKCQDGHIEMAACDAHRLAVAATKVESGAADEIMITKLALSDIVALLDGAEAVTLSTSDDFIFASDGRRDLIARTATDRMPAIDRVIPKNLTASITIDRDALKQAVERVALVIDGVHTKDGLGRPVEFAVEGHDLTLAAEEATRGQSVERVAMVGKGPTRRTKYSPRYVLDFLTGADPGDVQIEQTDNTEMGATLWTPLAASPVSYRYVLMPIRL